MKKAIPVLLGAAILLVAIVLVLRGSRQPEPSSMLDKDKEPALKSEPYPSVAEQPVTPQREIAVVEEQVTASEGGFVEGFAFDEEGTGVPDVKVTARVRSSIHWWNAETAKDGHYRIGPFGETVLLMQFQHETYVDTSLTEVPVGKTDADVVMRSRGAISGVVLDKATDEPVPDFAVAAGFPTMSPSMMGLFGGRSKSEMGHGYHFGEPERFRSDRGEFTLTPDRLGKVGLRASGLGHVEATVYLDEEVRSGEEIRNVVIRLPRGASIRGTVLAAFNSEPVAGADVHWCSGPNGPWADAVQAVTDKEGKFLIVDVKPGSQSLGVKHHDFAPSSIVTLDLREGQEEQVTIRLESGGTILGYVTVNGKRETGVEIRSAGPGKTIRNVRTDENGYYELSGSAAGRHELSALIGKQSQRAYVEVQGGRATRKDFQFRAGSGIIEGYVTVNGEPIGEPPVDVTVLPVWAGFDRLNPRTAYTSADGFYRVDELAPDTYGVSVDIDAMATGALVRVRDGQVAKVDLNIQVGTATITGTVSWPESYEVAGVLVRDASDTGLFSMENLVVVRSQMLARMRCKTDGGFEVPNLPAGSYNVTGVCLIELDDGSFDDIIQASKTVTVKEGEVAEVNFEL